MARLIDAFEQFFDSAGNPLIQGKIFFFESGSSTAAKDTFSNSDETNVNSNPVILNGDGRVPNTFGTGSYRAVVTDRDEVQILVRDPVGGGTGTTFGADWNNESFYSIGDVVRDDGRYWTSLTGNNQGNQPSTDDGSNWVLFPAFPNNASSTGHEISTSGIITQWGDITGTAQLSDISTFDIAFPNAVFQRYLALYDKFGGTSSGLTLFANVGDFTLATIQGELTGYDSGTWTAGYLVIGN